MSFWRGLTILAMAGGLTAGIASCGSEKKLVCGSDTTEQNGTCVATVYSNGWDNALTQELGVSLLKSYSGSSDGPDAWNTTTNPLVFISTMGPGYGGKLGGSLTWPGVVVIDANTYTVVASRSYDMTAEGWTSVFEPHGLAVSMDGKWIYLPSGDGNDNGRLLIINARTLKLDKVIKTRGRPHHGKCFTNSVGKELVVFYGWAQPPFVMDPADNNRVVGGVSYNESGIEGYLYFVTPDGKEMWGSGRWRQGSVASGVDGGTALIEGQLFFSVDTTTWKLKNYMNFPGETTPIWIEFSPDNKYAFVSGGHSSSVLRYTRALTPAQNKAAPAITPVGVVGPYGLRLNWTGTKIFAVGKQEGAGNLGIDLGIVDTSQIGDAGYVGERIVTNCLRGDHGSLHPTSSKDEFWISCNSSFEVVVIDMTNKVVKQRIAVPDAGSTHSGAFVQYDGAWVGRVLSDQNGLHGTALAEQLSKWTLP
ncbi:MAG: hypothetical protein HYY84_20675 [Deltaproteobacteria bacterium]|nr:hypothetical protein [Deltaproteobacteria bacterium]